MKNLGSNRTKASFPSLTLVEDADVRNRYLQRSGIIYKFMKALFKFFELEPVCMEWHHVRSTILFIISFEVFFQPFEHFLRIVIVKNALV